MISVKIDLPVLIFVSRIAIARSERDPAPIIPIHQEQQRRGKHIRNIYQVIMIVFMLGLIGLAFRFYAASKVGH